MLKEVVFLGGLLAVLLYALGISGYNRQEKPKTDEYEVIRCQKIRQNGDTIWSLQTIVKVR